MDDSSITKDETWLTYLFMIITSLPIFAFLSTLLFLQQKMKTLKTTKCLRCFRLSNLTSFYLIFGLLPTPIVTFLLVSKDAISDYF
ncbi:hypothetical protein HanRHA438_Chr14g0665091 [Helianthus annuus]|nr:hypothetical protein HanRHA438_Chr14g0665091 [Helianthus annuus]